MTKKKLHTHHVLYLHDRDGSLQVIPVTFKGAEIEYYESRGMQYRTSPREARRIDLHMEVHPDYFVSVTGYEHGSTQEGTEAQGGQQAAQEDAESSPTVGVAFTLLQGGYRTEAGSGTEQGGGAVAGCIEEPYGIIKLADQDAECATRRSWRDFVFHKIIKPWI